MATRAQFYDQNGELRIDGTLVGGGGAQWVDCGLVTVASLIVTGKTTLYTTGTGAFVSAVRFGPTLTLPDNVTAIAFEVGDYIGRPNSATDWYAWLLPSGEVHDAVGLGVGASEFYFNGTSGGVVGSKAVPPLQTGAFTASLSTNGNAGPTVGAPPGWQANHVYDANALIIAAGHIWATGAGLTSGGSQPNFAGNIGNPALADGTGTWGDAGAVPTQGSVHVYLEVVTPAAP